MENLRILPSVEDAKRDLSVDLENQSQDVEDVDDRRSVDTVARRPRERGARRRLVARRDAAGTGWLTTT
tara:strand:- start:1736 stop:1942 length:207 start_codon:yes stop_codon:yes gene_type:complete